MKEITTHPCDGRQTLPKGQVYLGFECLFCWLWVFKSLIILKTLQMTSSLPPETTPILLSPLKKGLMTF